MGQILRRVGQLEAEVAPKSKRTTSNDEVIPKRFPDLSQLPPELGLMILSNLSATDLCLAACVWNNLADDEVLWHALCRSQWKYASIYSQQGQPDFDFKKLYMRLDEATLTFNADAEMGLEYIIKEGLVRDTAIEIAKFLHGARHINWREKRGCLEKRPDILEKLVQLHDFENQFLPNALRDFFNETNPPNERNDYLSLLVEKFSQRFCACNPTLGMSIDTVYVVCFSLIMLSVDLSSPHIKNKMSKREFIRNTRQAVVEVNDELAGHLYDNVYLIGHVAPRV